MLVRIAEKIIYAAGGILGRICMALRLSPNAITVFGLAFTTFVGVLYGMGYLSAGGCVLTASCLFDSIDGFVARKTGRVTKFGGFFDSSLDRYADMAIYGGLLVYIARDPNARLWFSAPAIIIVLAAAGAFLVSYTKARGDNVVGEIKQGYWGRVERLILLIIGTCIGRGGTALLVLATLPHLTVIHRMLIVKAKLILTGQENPQGSKGVRRQGEVPDAVGDFGRGLTPVTRRLWWARLSADGAMVIFPWPLRIIFLDYKRGSIPYDIACAFFVLTNIFIPLEWMVQLYGWIVNYFG
jgi:CDP-diacylglycerol--glycerol-3-phosphate 3-phosphatidyltransferase